MEEDTVNSFSAATSLLEKRKEMLEVQQTLRSKREEYGERLDKIKTKEKDLSQKRVELTENIIQLDKFIADNEIKTTRAKQKKDTEKKLREGNEAEIDTLKGSIQNFENECLKKHKVLEERDSKYHRFLQHVVTLRGDENPEEVDRVIGRYDTLSGNNEELKKDKQALEQELLNMKKIDKEFKETKKTYLIELNHKISTLSKRLEKEIEKNNKIKDEAEEAIERSNKTKVTLGQLEMACQNLYTRVTSKNGSQIKRVHDNISDQELDMMKMLKVIHDCMSDFLFIVASQAPSEEKPKQRPK
ncbi:hypothetical protein AKO1_008006 [Acrasis kona]|uniref:DUF4200 domain-containing protein n=1 Tax=Acrasis kona TaxID=1008807 RepID=A0AAW2YPX4_9EUKA